MKNFKSFMEEGFGKYSDKIDKKKLMKKYKENEDNNAHTENYLMLARFFGTEDEVAEIKKIMKNFSKNKNSEVVTLSTLDKKSVSKIKAKLLSYVS